MTFLADLHVHSHFSRATSRDCRPGPLAESAAAKGLTVIGSGDCTHAGWREELRTELVEEEEGLYRLREADGAAAGVRFLVTGEISCIYKQDGKTRKIHHLLLLPNLEAAERVGSSLERRGANLSSDGRPIIGMDSHTLLALILEAAPDATLIPAHIWTPHFSLFGANSGFDALEECYGDLAGEIPAYETGLSSDPPMNWRLGALDRLTLISNSDAHSPGNLGREANEFEAGLSYRGLSGALRRRNGRVTGTIEFFPEEGKYHFDGHRKCGVCWHPRETAAAGGLCRVCGRPVTTGVLNRVMQLADRPEGARPEGAAPYCSLVSLVHVVAAGLGRGPESKRVKEINRDLLRQLGPEIPLLRGGDLCEVERIAGSLTAEAVRRVRTGEITYRPGYDGLYGELTVFSPEERSRLSGQAALFSLPRESRAALLRGDWEGPSPARNEEAAVLEPAVVWQSSSPLHGLDEEQINAVTCMNGPVVVLAGPGAGKTRTLVQRIAYLIGEGVEPGSISAVTFTHRAADEMRKRLVLAAGRTAESVKVGTFHRFCLDMLAEDRGEPPMVLDEREAASILSEPAPRRKGAGTGMVDSISLLLSRGLRPGDEGVPAEIEGPFRRYMERLDELGAYDYDTLLLAALDLLRSGSPAADRARARTRHLLIDEFQDINAVQYMLIQELAGSGGGMFVIGDPNQAIYGFRGADYRYFDRLAKDYPQCTVCRLRTNYRSTGSLVRAASAFMQIEGIRAAKPAGPPLRFLPAGSGRGMARSIVKEIERLVGGTGMNSADRQSGDRIAHPYSFSDIAVLFRTARQAGPLEEALLAGGIPYRILGRRALLAADEVREALDILRCADAYSDLRFAIALRETRYDVGSEPFERIRNHARENLCPYAAAAADLLRRGQFTINLHERIQSFLDLLSELRAMSSTSTAARLLLRAAPPGADRTSRPLAQVTRAAGDRTLSEFLLRLSIGQETDQERREEGPEPGEAVSLLTMHAAKGLEFPVVILADLADGIVPWRAAETDEELAEERRLFYVAMTRAAEALILMGPEAGGRREPSRFLNDLPLGPVERASKRTRKKRLEQKKLF